MTVADVVYLAVFLAFLAFELWAIQNNEPGDTFTERTRFWFRTHTRLGVWLFLLVSGLFFAWWVAHIADTPRFGL